MRSFKIFCLMLLSVFSNYIAEAQTATESEIKAHVLYLSDDALEGRLTGSEGEKLAADYIEKEFKEMGLTPGYGNSFLQSFDALAGKKVSSNTALQTITKIHDAALAFPHPMSANKEVHSYLVEVGFGITSPENNYNDYANKNVQGKIVLIKLSSPDGTHPHSKYIEHNDERIKIKIAEKNGAVGVIFYNADPNYVSPIADYRRNTSPENIPVYFIKAALHNEFISYRDKLTMRVELLEDKKTGNNVVGFIDNKAATTVVIGAHYDHLGHGEIEGSLYRGVPAIHNGADDNASGVALILELARKLKSSDLKNNNYVIIAFSGEEMGLFGSKAFVSSDIFKDHTTNYMLNFDMVGRLDSANTLIINGVGSSSNWTILNEIKNYNFTFKTTESGIGPSDQTPFYLADIPVLHFFTGAHNDYHKPTDDADKINYIGIENILEYTYILIDSLDDDGKINFTKTKEENNESTPRFTVTMGVIPDYAFTGRGMRIDGVSDGKPAQKAGVIAGDVVIKMGSYEVADMMGYMHALGKFKKGDSTVITIIRNEISLDIPIQF